MARLFHLKGGIPWNPARAAPELKATAKGAETTVNQVFHGNDLRNTATTYGYHLIDQTTGAIAKIGETLYPSTRYSKKFLEENDLKMEIQTTGSKLDMHNWQHEEIKAFEAVNGYKPSRNKSYY